jgi:hypothetical protein
MHQKVLACLVALAGVLCAAATATAGVIRDDVADSTYVKLAQKTPFKSVGKVTGTTASTTFMASGVLIANHWVLTAAHVVDDATSVSVKIGKQTFAASAWIAFPDWNGDLLAGYDVGLMYFDADISAATGIAPATRYRGSRDIGRLGTSVGFGMTGGGSTGATIEDGRKRAGRNKIDTVLMTEGEMNRVLLSDFDGPEASNNSMGSATASPLEFLISNGDSGGGLFAQFGEKYYLIGIHSFGWGFLDGDLDSSYGDISGHTRIRAFNDWIDAVLAGLVDMSSGGTATETNTGAIGAFSLARVQAGAAVPEPTTLGLAGAALALLALARRRFRTT